MGIPRDRPKSSQFWYESKDTSESAQFSAVLFDPLDTSKSAQISGCIPSTDTSKSAQSGAVFSPSLRHTSKGGASLDAPLHFTNMSWEKKFREIVDYLVEYATLGLLGSKIIVKNE